MAKAITQMTLSQYRALVAGIPLYCATTVFTVAGQTFTALQAVSFIQNVLNAVAATATAKGAWKEAILAEDKLVAADGDTVRMIRNAIAAMFSAQVNTLNAFEITPRKPYTPLTTAKRAAATAKANATRLARGTASKKKKAEIVGDVTGVTITPVTAGSSASTSGGTSAVSAGATGPGTAGVATPAGAAGVMTPAAGVATPVASATNATGGGGAHS